MSLLNAHIFKRRSRGDREEVRIKLFNLDGSDYEGGGPGGSGASSTFYGQAYNQEALTDNDGFGHELDITGYQVDGEFEVSGKHILAPVGAYVVQFRTHWTNIGAPSSGHLNVRLIFVYGESNNEHEVLFLDQMAADGIEPDLDRTVIALPPDNGYFKVVVDQNIQPDDEATPNLQSWLTMVKL